MNAQARQQIVDAAFADQARALAAETIGRLTPDQMFTIKYWLAQNDFQHCPIDVLKFIRLVALIGIVSVTTERIETNAEVGS